MAKTIIEYETVEQSMVSIDLTQVHAIENRTGAMGVFCVHTDREVLPGQEAQVHLGHKRLEAIQDHREQTAARYMSDKPTEVTYEEAIRVRNLHVTVNARSFQTDMVHKVCCFCGDPGPCATQRLATLHIAKLLGEGFRGESCRSSS
jgi:hypothetical protein